MQTQNSSSLLLIGSSNSLDWYPWGSAETLEDEKHSCTKKVELEFSKTKPQDSLLDVVAKAARSHPKDEENREQGELVPFQHPTKCWKHFCKGTFQTLWRKSHSDQHAWKGCLRKNTESRNRKALPVDPAASKVPSIKTIPWQHWFLAEISKARTT